MTLDGVLVVDKPAGMTSAAVVHEARRALGVAKAGHTGTLDPMATGVLPLVLGAATKIAALLLAEDKSYEGELELGLRTDTDDADGHVLERRPAEGVTGEALARAMARLTGAIEQVPPMVSALRHKGQRLHRLHRQGQAVDVPPRPVHVHRFELLGFDPPRARFAVDCAKGTYVRALVRDVGAALGCGATLTALRRTRCGAFTLEGAVPLAAVGERGPTAVIPPAEALGHLPAMAIDAAEARRVGQGQRLPLPEALAAGGPFRIVGPDGALCAVARPHEGKMAYVRVFAPSRGTENPAKDQ